MNWFRTTLAAAAALLLAPAHGLQARANIRTRWTGSRPAPMSSRRRKRASSSSTAPIPKPTWRSILGEFHKMFPKIATNYVRLQAGALYAKVNAERQAHQYLADVMQITDMSFVLDFQKRKGYVPYVSPELAAYKPEYKSNPEGLWTWGVIVVAGIAYNPNLVTADEAPKSWKDLLDPKWKDVINIKVSTSGLQHVTWYMIRQIHGDEYWKKFGELNPACLRFLRAAVRPHGERPGQGDLHRAVLRLSAVQGKGRADRVRQSAGRPVGDAWCLRHSGEPAAPGGRAAVHGLGSRRARTEGAR